MKQWTQTGSLHFCVTEPALVNSLCWSCEAARWRNRFQGGFRNHLLRDGTADFRNPMQNLPTLCFPALLIVSLGCRSLHKLPGIPTGSASGKGIWVYCGSNKGVFAKQCDWIKRHSPKPLHFQGSVLFNSEGALEAFIALLVEADAEALLWLHQVDIVIWAMPFWLAQLKGNSLCSVFKHRWEDMLVRTWMVKSSMFESGWGCLAMLWNQKQEEKWEPELHQPMQ